MNRRSFLTGLLAAPLVVKTPGILMPVKQIHVGGIIDEINWWEPAGITRAKWQEIGAALADDIQQRIQRQGFMRTVISRSIVTDDYIPRISMDRTTASNVQAILTDATNRLKDRWGLK